ncbi:Crp/Fnr family transcriptional regulator [Desulfoscipio sp. XC116]|uniref:Crp/Fnr family transcriptional regulator n=1 Tax=Desulfoscipio sp. XC116 TaxID=3144975 RepID=UPI00325BEF14
MNRKLSVLKKCTLFKNKEPDEIENLLSNINFRTDNFVENDVIFSPVQNADKMGIVLSGAADVQKLFPTGKVVIIERKRNADMIAEASMFSRLDYYSDTIVACKPCEIMLITKNDLLTLFSLDHTVLLNYLEHVSNSTLVLKNKIGILSLDSIRAKIAGYLIYDYKMNGSHVISLPFSKKEWAEYMDVSRTSLSRELRGLEFEGILSFDKRTIVIKELNRLEKILSL